MTSDSKDKDSVIGEKSLAESSATTMSLKSVHSEGDSFTEVADNWLHSSSFYHGYLPREDIPALLLKHGDFLVRLSETNIKGSGKKKKRTTSRVISVLASPESKGETIPIEKRPSLIKNIIIMHKNQKWWIDPASQFDTLASLFENYMTKPLLVEKDSVLLKRGVGLCRWEFKHANVQVGRLLGRGAYGEVRKGTVIRKNGQIVIVAVKTLTLTSVLTRELIREIMKEARTMRDLHHPNVVSMIGVVLVDHPLYILLEYVSGGALDVYLRRKRAKITKSERLSMADNVAQGMEYIHKSNVIHRDLAARNCLYDRNNTVKISDFGLSRNGTTYRMKTAQKMPIKWMAPESITTYTFTQKTDVYTFGVLIYEIFSGTGPYEDLRNSVVKKMIVEGKVNQFPSNTPIDVVTYVNEKLWCKDPEKRPNFTSIVEAIGKLLVAHSEKTPEEERSKSLVLLSEGKTTATVDIEVPAGRKKKSAARAMAEKAVEKSTSREALKKEAKEETKKTEKAAPAAKEEVKKGSAEKSTAKEPKVKAEDASCYLKPPESATKVDVDSHHDDKEINVEFRTKPVFGRRSKFKRFRK
ncbi:unnamed protein product [Cylicocyclus nassatus]|uniref:Tyrosine-protein kinase n=1 Tax=Cylicocyclus nassatus TaxID=53992 RepID=A0AA36GGB6_CYLNA|nr:unnamed protein product [Cylicocyclus nassatus]